MIYFANYILKHFLRRKIQIDIKMPTFYIVQICCDRMFMLLRGVCSVTIKNKKVFFRGKRVKIYCPQKLKVGRCVTIQDEVIINAASVDGVILSSNVSIGMRSSIKASGSLMALGKGLYMGQNSSIGENCFIGAAGGVYIGDYVAIGQNVRFHSENHNFEDTDRLICEQGVSNKGIRVGNDCWIGAGSVFLDGVEVGDGCVIGANTLVNKNIPSYSVAAGNPVRILRNRKFNLYKEEF